LRDDLNNKRNSSVIPAQIGADPGGGLGIIKNDGTPKLAWDEWVSRGTDYANA
jgi:hypothetical protein